MERGQPSHESSGGGSSDQPLVTQDNTLLAGQSSKVHHAVDPSVPRPAGSPLSTGGVLARIRHAETALAAAQAALREKQIKLEAGEREQQAGASASRMADAERQRLADDGARRTRMEIKEALKSKSASWVDPAELQRLLDAAREKSVEAATLASADAALDVQRQRVREAREQCVIDGVRSEDEIARKVRLLVVRTSLNELVGQSKPKGALDSDTTLTTLHRMIGTARDAGVEPASLSAASDLLQQNAAVALGDETSPPGSLDAMSMLSDVVEICPVGTGDSGAQLGVLLEQAQQDLKQQQPLRAELLVASLNQMLLAGATKSPAHDIAMLENVVDSADNAVARLGDDIESSEHCARLRQLKVMSQKRLEGRRDEQSHLEQERRDTSASAWRVTRQQLEMSISVAKAAVEANEDRLRLAMEIERTELNRRDASMRHLAAQQQVKSDEEDRFRVQMQQVVDAREEVKRLKWSLKMAQDGAQAAVRKAEEEASRIKQRAAEETRQAQAEARSVRREFDKASQRMKSANQRKEREASAQDQKQVRDFREREERLNRLLKEEQERVGLERQMAEEARTEADRLRNDQDKVIGGWQQAEKDATALAQQNAGLAKKALEAQQKAEEVARHAQQEVKDIQEEVLREKEGLKKGTAEAEQAREQDRLLAQHAKKEAELLKDRQQELLEELKAEREHMQKARDKQEELEKTIADQRTERDKLNDKLNQMTHKWEQGERDLTEAKEEAAKLQTETAKAVDGLRKARKETARLKAEQSEGAVSKQTAELEAREAKDRVASLMKEIEKLKDEVEKLKQELAKQGEYFDSKHQAHIEELQRVNEKIVHQKEAQLEYAEDQLTRLEASEKARKAKNAGTQQRIDDDVRAAYEKLRVKTDEFNATKKELEQFKSKAKSVDGLKNTLKRVQKEHEELLKHLDQARDEKATLERLKTEAEQAREKASKEERKARHELEQLRTLGYEPNNPQEEHAPLWDAAPVTSPAQAPRSSGGAAAPRSSGGGSSSDSPVRPGGLSGGLGGGGLGGGGLGGALGGVDVVDLARAILDGWHERQDSSPERHTPVNSPEQRQIVETEQRPNQRETQRARREVEPRQIIEETELLQSLRETQRVRRESIATAKQSAARQNQKPALRIKSIDQAYGGSTSVSTRRGSAEHFSRRSSTAPSVPSSRSRAAPGTSDR